MSVLRIYPPRPDGIFGFLIFLKNINCSEKKTEEKKIKHNPKKPEKPTNQTNKNPTKPKQTGKYDVETFDSFTTFCCEHRHWKTKLTLQSKCAPLPSCLFFQCGLSAWILYSAHHKWKKPAKFKILFYVLLKSWFWWKYSVLIFPQVKLQSESYGNPSKCIF